MLPPNARNGNEGELRIPQSSSINEASPLVSYLGHSLGESYPSAEMQSVYFAHSADWANNGSGKMTV